MSIKQIFLLALIIRLLIMPFFFHPDVKDINIRVSYLSQGVLNIYDFLKQNEQISINTPDFVYPPLTYFTLGVYQIMIKPILGNDFNHWLFDFSGLSADNPYIFRYLFLLKLPFLVFDFLVGLLLYKTFVDIKQKKLALFFWFFNPLNLYGIYAIGQFDIIPTFLTFFSWFLWKRDKFISSGIMLGLGAAFKSFPLLLIPLFLISPSKLIEKLKFLLSVTVIYGISLMPFISSPGFQKDVLFSNLGKGVLELQLHLGPISISVFVILYVSLLFSMLINKSKPLWPFILSALLLIFSLSRFHPQWIVWITPFLTLATVYSRLKFLIPFFFISYFLIFLFYGDRFLSTGLLSPISLMYLEIPDFTQFMASIKVILLQNILQTIFAFISFFIIWKVLGCNYD